MSLFWRIFLLNAVVLIVATVLLAVGPLTVSTPVLPAEAIILTAGLVALLLANALLLRVGLAPLHRLTSAMTTIDLLRPGPRLAVGGRAEVADLISTFNSMLGRLETERATSNARALSAQEEERRRVAQELHDEIGQSLTAVLLELSRVTDHAPEPVRKELRQVQEITRGSLEEIRRIARRLRPGVLEELGLVSALKALTRETPAGAGLAVRLTLSPDLPDLDATAELVVYRVAQEGLTNTVRHAGAEHLDVSLHRRGESVMLRLADDGRGLGEAEEGAGIRGMRERALLVGAELTVNTPPRGGTEVTLHLPVTEESDRP